MAASDAALSHNQEADNITSENKRTMLIFDLVGEHCGLEAKYVQTIVHMPPRITRVPNAPYHVRGVINLRGTVVPVLDCAMKMSMGETIPSNETRIVIAEVEGITFGFLVDAVREVREVADSTIERNGASGHQGNIDVNYIEGVAKLDTGRLVILLDLVSLFDVAELLEEEGGD